MTGDSDSRPPVDPSAEASSPSAADDGGPPTDGAVRAWARAVGFPVAERGRVSLRLREIYAAVHGRQGDGATARRRDGATARRRDGDDSRRALPAAPSG